MARHFSDVFRFTDTGDKDYREQIGNVEKWVSDKVVRIFPGFILYGTHVDIDTALNKHLKFDQNFIYNLTWR